jgi:hypothetical protein
MGDRRLIRSVARGDQGRKFDGSGANEMPWCVEYIRSFRRAGAAWFGEHIGVPAGQADERCAMPEGTGSRRPR